MVQKSKLLVVFNEWSCHADICECCTNVDAWPSRTICIHAASTYSHESSATSLKVWKFTQHILFFYWGSASKAALARQPERCLIYLCRPWIHRNQIQCKSLKSDISDFQIPFFCNYIYWISLKNYRNELGFRIAFEPSHFFPRNFHFFKKKSPKSGFLDPVDDPEFPFIAYLICQAFRPLLKCQSQLRQKKSSGMSVSETFWGGITLPLHFCLF